MRWTWGVVLVFGLVVVASAGAAIQPDGTDCPVETGDTEEPGEELANVVGAQESVVARELERRGFNATLANASDPDERATVIATELERIEVRLIELETCQKALVESREDGDLTAQEYREQAGTLEPDIEDVSERLNRAEAAASDLPPRVRDRNDIDEDRFDELTERVDELEAFVAEPDRTIESADDGNEQAPMEPEPGNTFEAESPRATETTETDGESTDEGTTTERTTTTEPSDDGNEPLENGNGNGPPDDEDENGTTEPGNEGGKTGVSFG